ncbi:hypothetical protein BGZ60DRAFT_566990 [Tricladium varicosporioides]|nr:hypothetical protein BGZ60DRAFT_566990 [Hymenoscyphus varicosporioides]
MAIQNRVSSLLRYAQSLLDGVVDPSTRQKAYNNILTFSQEKPLLFSFILAQSIFSLTPLLLFTSFSIGCLLLASISAILFSIFWIGLALAILVPTLFVTVGLGLFVWVWVVGSWLVGRWAWSIVFEKGGKGMDINGVNGKGIGGVKVSMEKADS